MRQGVRLIGPAHGKAAAVQGNWHEKIGLDQKVVPARAIQAPSGLASSVRSLYFNRCTNCRTGPPSKCATARARAKTGGSATASGDKSPSLPRSMAKGVPRRSQKGRSIKRTCAQQGAQSEPEAPVDWRQLRQAGGKTVSIAACARLHKTGKARVAVVFCRKSDSDRKAVRAAAMGLPPTAVRKPGLPACKSR